MRRFNELRQTQRKEGGQKSCRWSAITATLLAISFGIFKIFVSYEEFSLLSLPAPNSLIYSCISLPFGRFPILELFKRVVNLLSQLGRQVCLNNTNYKALKALILKNGLNSLDFENKKKKIKFPGFYIVFL
jgi:hypothetical protein